MDTKKQLATPSTPTPNQYLQSTLQITPTSATPRVHLDAVTGELELSGVSIPENVTTFYAPIIEWLREYIQMPAAQTRLKFSLDYFNTATSKVFMELITELEAMQDVESRCRIEWHCKADDIDMQEAGEDYAMITRIPFDFFKEK